MYKYITKKLLLSLSLWIFVWLWILVTYAANITSISWTYNSWDTLGIEWFNDIKARLSNIYGSWTNVWIWTVSPSQKLEVVWWSIKATGWFIIETRTTNPTSPETGRMWLINP